MGLKSYGTALPHDPNRPHRLGTLGTLELDTPLSAVIPPSEQAIVSGISLKINRRPYATTIKQDA
jgi:hypothetical protein